LRNTCFQISLVIYENIAVPVIVTGTEISDVCTGVQKVEVTSNDKILFQKQNYFRMFDSLVQHNRLGTNTLRIQEMTILKAPKKEKTKLN
jgi:hypothetical protein